MYGKLIYPRVSFFLFLLIMLSAISGHTQVHRGEMDEPSDPIANNKETFITKDSESIGPWVLVTKGLFGFYQQIIGSTKGTDCPMFPSCSEYARLAVIKNGLIVGILMSSDRLHRCGHDLHLYSKLWLYSKGWRYDDPP